MIVLKIIGIIIFLALLYLLIEKLNTYTYKKYSYKFFTESTLGIYMVIYCGLYIGKEWYISALHSKGDILNGIVIIVIALLIFLFVLISNIKKSNYLFGFFFTFVQAILFIPFCIIGIFFILIVAAFFAQAKPVYRIDD